MAKVWRVTRRDFIRKGSLGLAFAVAGGLLSRGFTLIMGRRIVPPDLPGEGSIFQPRNDPRRRS